jgi:uncharacterized protein (DUF983 family)
MPTKEDWDWSSWKHKKTRFLCPYCGNDTVSYEAFKKSWRCARCGASFIRPTKRAPSFVKTLSLLLGWLVTIGGVVYLIVSEPFWVGVVMIAVGVLMSGVALALLTRWR